jgi:hypothetical protein
LTTPNPAAPPRPTRKEGPLYESMKVEAARSCGGCNKPVTHANQIPQCGFDKHEPADYVCVDVRTETGFLHPGECCKCFDARTWGR